MAAHELPETRAFIHFEFQPSVLTPFGAWLFHAIRFHEPLAKHDGVLSALRSHRAERLLEAARAGAPRFLTGMYSTRLSRLPIPRAFHTLVGIRPELHDAFVRALGRRSSRLGAMATGRGSASGGGSGA
jgi:hypothetical protein